MTLPDLLSETLDLMKVFYGRAAMGVASWNASWTTFIDIAYAQFDTMRSIIELVRLSRYRECFVLLRTVLEHYAILLLMIKGKKWKETRTYRIDPSSIPSGLTLKEARDKKCEEWRRERDTGNPNYRTVKNVTPGHADNQINVTHVFEGLYESKDVERKGETVSIYYFVLDEYDPNINFLSSLPTVYVPGGQVGSVVKLHKRLYSQFLFIERVVKNLGLNDLLSEEQEDRFRVHYNFLSSYAHPTKNQPVGHSFLNYSMSAAERQDSILEELVLMYVGRMQSLLLQLLLDHFRKVNPNSELRVFEEQVTRLDESTRDLWFVFDQPTLFDIAESDMKKRWMRTVGQKAPNTVVYYENPADRLRKMRATQKPPQNREI